MITGQQEAEPEPSGSAPPLVPPHCVSTRFFFSLYFDLCFISCLCEFMRPRKNKRFKKKRSQTGWESSTSQRNMTTRCGQKFCLGSAPPHRSSSHCSLIIRKVLTRPCSVCVCGAEQLPWLPQLPQNMHSCCSGSALWLGPDEGPTDFFLPIFLFSCDELSCWL